MLQRAVSAVGGGSGGGGISGKFSPNPTASDFSEVELGFTPTDIYIYTLYNGNGTMCIHWNIADDIRYETYGSVYEGTSDSTFFKPFFVLDGTKFKYKAPNGAYAYATTYIAVSNS